MKYGFSYPTRSYYISDSKKDGKMKSELTIPRTIITAMATAIKMPAMIPESTSSVCKTVPSIIVLLPDGRIVAVNK